MSGNVHLTKRVVDALETEKPHRIVWDDDVSGLGVRVTKAGVKSFVVDYTTGTGRRRRYTIGRYGAYTVEQARKEANKVLGSVAGGSDPVGEKQAKRSEDTVKSFAAEYLAHAKAYKKPASLRADTYHLDEVIVKKLGSRKLSEVTPEDVANLHKSLDDHPTQANRVLATFRHMYTVAGKWGRVPHGCNPCVGIEQYKETRRTRYLTAEELTRLGKRLDALEEKHPYPVRAVRLLLLTGCRVNEILSLAWSDVDLGDTPVLHLRDAKAGPRDVPLGAAAVELLKTYDGDESEWVIPSARRKGRHMVNLNDFWYREVQEKEKLQEKANFQGVRLHDLRHTVGATGAGAGLSMLLIANVLGHKQVSTTERYSHVSRGPLHDAADRISGDIAAAMNGASGEVVDMTTGRKAAQ